MASEHLQTFTDDNFHRTVLNSAAPVLVDFWGERCPPCRMIAPSIEALAGELHGRAVVGTLNVDENPFVPSRYGIRGTPSLLVFKRGEVVDAIVGAADKVRIRALVERHI